MSKSREGSSLRGACRLAALLSAAALGAAPARGLTLEGLFDGTTRYVSKSGSDANGGTGWQDAKLTIQAAVNLCADGDTVVVDDGEYSDTTPWTATADGTTYANPAVVQITKRIRLVSRNGRRKTHIVGRWAGTATGVANDGTAHRCIYIAGPGNAQNVLIEGFTIRDGATAGSGAGNNAVDSGGGVCGGASSTRAQTTGYLVDCDVVNCRAGIGAAVSRGIVTIRCSFRGNRGVNGATTQHVFYRTDCAYNCVFSGNGHTTRGGACFSLVQGATVVNCTFVGNTCYGFKPNNNDSCKFLVYNCAFLGDGEAATGGTTGGDALVYLTNCVQTATGGRMAAEGTDARCAVGVPSGQFFYALDAGTWRSLPGGALLDAGTDDARAAAAAFVPEEYLDADFFGNPRTAGAHIDIGAIEAQGGVGTPATGLMTVGDNVAVSTNGVACAVPAVLPFAFERFPGQVRLAPDFPAGTPFFGFAITGGWTLYRFPDLGADGGAWLTPPPADVTISIAARAATGEKWVEADYAGGDSDGTPERPYTTITDAAAASEDYGLVHVRKGVYAVGSTLLDGHTWPARVAIDRSVAVRSVDGADETLIVGDASTRCVAVRSYGYDVHVQGFTVTGGTADGSADNASCGGGFWVTPQTWANATGLPLGAHCAQVTDCVFSNNVARQAAAMNGGWAQRCVFTDNRIGATFRNRGAVASSAILSACLVTNNLQSNASAICSVWHCAPYNVTFAESNKCADASTDYRPADMNTPVFNCVFLGGYLDNNSANVAILPAGNVGDTSLPARTWLTRYARDVLFVDAAAGDLRLKPGSAAPYDGDGTADRAALFAVGDFEGNALRYMDGNPVPGAYSDVDTTARDWYVDAVRGDDANDGTTAAAAKKTLAAVLPLAGYGDTVHAAPGDYNEGSATYGDRLIVTAQGNSYSPARGVVPRGVTLIADQGPDVTFVTGQRGEDGNSLGTAAVRCLTALRESTVRGFTLRGGATFNTTGGERDENMGGCVLAPSCADGPKGTALIENCVVTDGIARTAGCVAGGILRRCTVTDGNSTSGANLSMYSRFEHCLVMNPSRNNSAIRLCGGMASTTFINAVGGNNHPSGGELQGALDGAAYENSIMITRNLASTDGSHPTLANVRNCIWCVGGGRVLIDDATSANVITCTLETAVLDAARGYRPLAGSPAIDAGDKTLLANLAGDASADFDGIQRVYNGQVDIGAHEYDIRPAMSAFLGRGVVVTDAAPEATLADEAVVLSAGEIVATLPQPGSARLLLPVRVTGSGAFAVYAGDATDALATATSADGATELRFAVPAGRPVRLAYEPGAADAGAAILGRLADASGLTVIFR